MCTLSQSISRSLSRTLPQGLSQTVSRGRSQISSLKPFAQPFSMPFTNNFTQAVGKQFASTGIKPFSEAVRKLVRETSKCYSHSLFEGCVAKSPVNNGAEKFAKSCEKYFAEPFERVCARPFAKPCVAPLYIAWDWPLKKNHASQAKRGWPNARSRQQRDRFCGCCGYRKRCIVTHVLASTDTTAKATKCGSLCFRFIPIILASSSFKPVSKSSLPYCLLIPPTFSSWRILGFVFSVVLMHEPVSPKITLYNLAFRGQLVNLSPRMSEKGWHGGDNDSKSNDKGAGKAQSQLRSLCRKQVPSPISAFTGHCLLELWRADKNRNDD